MRPNRLRDIWAAGGTVCNGWLALPCSVSAETMAHQGWDSLTIDLQHGLVDYAAMVPMLQAISTTATVPVVRVPWLEPGILMKTLDAGAYGVICPMVNSRAEAEAFVRWTTYAPRGGRSFGPLRALLYAGADYPGAADRTIVRFAMIETAQALAALDDILSVEGLDAIYVGPSDLSLSLGCRPVIDNVDPPAAEAIAHIAARARAHGVIAGIHNNSAVQALARQELGYRFLTGGTDTRMLASASQLALGALRGGGTSANSG
jgi:4-hydroxy-2-oxoheptanedioate aldolase